MARRGPARAIPKEVQAIFDKYSQKNVRRLKKEDALQLLEKEFNLSEQQADDMFNTFDKDKNGIMSLWEFQQFYQAVGDGAQAMIDKFTELDKDGSGKLDLEEARAGLQSMQTGTGRQLEEREIEFFLTSTKGDDDVIDIGEFANLLFCLKLYKNPPPPPQKK